MSLSPQPPPNGLERPELITLRLGLVISGVVWCPACLVDLRTRTPGDLADARLETVAALIEHRDAGHFDRRPLDTSNLPAARRILGRGAGPLPS